MEIRFTEIFSDWLDTLRDREARTLILKHVDRMRKGNLGDIKNIGESVFEKRIFYGAGYRLYFLNKSGRLIILLCGGDKSSQQKDIEKAQQMAREV